MPGTRNENSNTIRRASLEAFACGGGLAKNSAIQNSRLAAAELFAQNSLPVLISPALSRWR
jgi:hypothetical protein